MLKLPKLQRLAVVLSKTRLCRLGVYRLQELMMLMIIWTKMTLRLTIDNIVKEPATDDQE